MTTVSDRPKLVHRLLRLTEDIHPNPGWRLSYEIRPAGVLRQAKTHIAGCIQQFPDIHISMSLMRNNRHYDHLIIDFRSKNDWPTLIYTKWFDESIRPIIMSEPEQFQDRVEELIIRDSAQQYRRVWH